MIQFQWGESAGGWAWWELDKRIQQKHKKSGRRKREEIKLVHLFSWASISQTDVKIMLLFFVFFNYKILDYPIW